MHLTEMECVKYLAPQQPITQDACCSTSYDDISRHRP